MIIKPEAGQRWQFFNPVRNNKYIVQILYCLWGTNEVCVEIIQVISTDVPHKNFLGRIFTPTELTEAGPLDDRWSYLSGQEAEEEAEEETEEELEEDDWEEEEEEEEDDPSWDYG